MQSVSVLKANRKRLIKKLARRWEKENKTDVRVTGYGGMDWINLGQDRKQR
jgi:hypothetical protein